MAYNIVKSDGTPLVTVNDGQTNNFTTSLTLVGKNFAGYGTFLNENFVKLLENFASQTSPQNPLTGQLWYQTSTKLLQVYNGNAWKSISGAQAVADEPIYKVAGDLWFDSVNQQLKVWTGSSWVVIGPSFTSTTGTSGAVADTIIDSSQFTHVVVKFFVQNQLLGILSKDAAFQPAVNIPGFSSIKPGFNLARGRTPELLFYENANNAAYLGNLPAATYLTKDNAQLTSKLIIQSTDGIEIQEADGITTDFQLYVSNNNIQLVSQVRGNGFLIRTRPDNYAGTLQTVLAVDKVTGLITVLNDPTDPAGIATKNYVDNRDNTTRSYLSSNVSLIYGNISTNLANSTIVYGNVRSLQNELGYNNAGAVPASNDISIGGTHAFAYQRVTTGTTLAGNLVTLWANVAAIHANVLSNPGSAPSSTASMFSNVRVIQGQITNLQGDSLRRDGSTTIIGTLRPDAPNERDLGTEGARFAGFFANTANVTTITNLSSINNTGARGGFDPFVLRGNPLTLTGNIKLANPTDLSANTNLGFMHSITIEGGVDTRGHITTKAGNVYNLGSTLNWFDTIYVENIVSKNIAGNLSGGGGASLGATTFAGNIEPTTDLVYGIGTPSKRWLTVQSDEFISRYVSLTTTGIFVGSSAADETLDIGTSSKGFRDIYCQEVYGSAVEVKSTGIFTTGTPVDIGTSAAKFKDVYATNFYGRATQAQYADLAERFETDTAYPVGTVVVIGGDKEITVSTVDGDGDVFGVISTDPAYLMNSEAGSNETHPPVALAGRVPVRVVGPVRKGQRLISAGNGCARAAEDGETTPHNVIGRALESKTSDSEGLINAIVKVNV